MADFGAVFDKAKSDAETKIQGYRDAAQRTREEQEARFIEVMKPLNEIVRPIIENARDSLAPRGVEVLIDHDDFYNTSNGKRIAALHFQIVYAEFKGKIYTFQIESRAFSCNADDGTKKPQGQRAGVFATDRGNVTPRIVEDTVSRAINEIMQAMEQKQYREIFPNAVSVVSS